MWPRSEWYNHQQTIRTKGLEKKEFTCIRNYVYLNGVEMSATELDTQTLRSFAYHGSANGAQLALFPPVWLHLSQVSVSQS